MVVSTADGYGRSSASALHAALTAVCYQRPTSSQGFHLNTIRGAEMKRLFAIVIAFFAMINIAFAAVNINTATKDELATLNGIGPSKAQAIIDFRTKNGPFKTFADVDNVPGIGAGTMGKIQKEVTLTGKTSVAPGAAAPAKAATPAMPATPAKAAAPAPAKAATPAMPATPATPAKADAKAAAPAMAADAKKADKKEMTAAEKKAAAADAKKAKADAAKKEKADKKAAADAPKK